MILVWVSGGWDRVGADIKRPLNNQKTKNKNQKSSRASSRRLLRVIAAALVLLGSETMAQRISSYSTKEPVGQVGTNRWYTPANQVLTPAGRQVELPGLRPQALALSPDGRWLVPAGKTPELVVIEPPSGRILQHVALPSDSKTPELGVIEPPSGRI